MTLTAGSTRQREERLGEMADKWGPTVCEYKHARGRGVISHGLLTRIRAGVMCWRATRAKVVISYQISLSASKIVVSILKMLSQEVPSIIMVKS